MTAFFAPACLCFTKQNISGPHTSWLLPCLIIRKAVLDKFRVIMFSSISWPCLALILKADLRTSLGEEI